MAGTRQWVNLDPTNATQRKIPNVGTIPPERCGKTIKLKAKIKGKKKAGRPIFWGVQLGPNNVAPAEASNTAGGWALHADRGGFSAPGFYEKMVATDAKGESITTFDLSECGGDEFIVKAYKRGKGGGVKKSLKTETYVVWRQLFYQVTLMGPSVGKVTLPAIPDIPWSDVKKEYDDSRKLHNLRWSEVPPTNPVLTRHRALWTQSLKKKAGVEGYDRTREPMVVKVSVVDMLSSRATEKHTFTVARAQKAYPYTHPKVLFDMNSVDDKDDWFAGASATRITVGRNDFSKTGPSSIVCQVSQPMGIASRVCKEKVTVKLHVFSGSTAGFSWYNGVWVSEHRPTSTAVVVRPAAQKVALMVHELGHAIGMVASGVPTTDPSYPSGHPYYYGGVGPNWQPEHEHQGPHCWKGAQDVSTPGFSISDPFPGAGTCTMFGSLSSGTEKFCDDCSPFVRSRRPSVDGNFKPGDMLPTTW